jgi:hypothetical protein
MNPSQIPQLIAEIALADPRIRREDPTERRGQIHMWAGILTDVPYDFAIQAAHRHYAQSQWPILPADIATAWTAAVRDRLERHTELAPPVDPDNTAAYLTALNRQRQAIATGITPPTTQRELTAAGPHPDVAARLAEIGRYIPDEARAALAKYRPAAAAREAAIRAGQPDYLAVRCPWCDAPVNERCRSRRVVPGGGATSNKPRTVPHPARVELARDETAQPEGSSR